ncbi:HD domain-containing protein [Marinobacter sp. SS21]|uniref:HD domain-containing protein n=1 Tax=Marinobacter sp. SS21 TaxID=2979460 RepID=UPI0023302F41|nr:N-methyl-D-aspartate receptor NMDAR2C subunit [Marinobacter sp. SS21]MDC0661030.1 N-methyl-D-aspartate receptor NMDAR2C subunit [Marinobacter sp. SS21]
MSPSVSDDTVLNASWARCWSALGARGDGEALKQRLIAAYDEPHRKYHSRQHLVECLTLLESCLGLAEDAAAVTVALWFHDAIYDVQAGDNEARSAAWAGEALRAAGVCPERIGRVKALVLATRHSVLPEGIDQQLLVDIDLAILGATPARFAQYQRQVREEYAWVPDAPFHSKRRDILMAFLARQPIYRLPPLRKKLESQARDNLRHAIETLQGASE